MMSKQKLRPFFFYYSCGILFCVLLIILNEFLIPRSRIHEGEILTRSLFWGPLRSNIVFFFEWGIQIICITFILLKKREKFFYYLLTLIFGLGLTQIFSNHKLLVFINLIGLCFFLEKEGREKTLQLLRLELFVVYFFSAAHKIKAGFYNGESLQNLMGLIVESPYFRLMPDFFYHIIIEGRVIAILLSIATIILEILIPISFKLNLKYGLYLQELFHFFLLLFIPGLGIAVFGISIISMALLFHDKPFGNGDVTH